MIYWEEWWKMALLKTTLTRNQQPPTGTMDPSWLLAEIWLWIPEQPPERAGHITYTTLHGSSSCWEGFTEPTHGFSFGIHRFHHHVFQRFSDLLRSSLLPFAAICCHRPAEFLLLLTVLHSECPWRHFTPQS